MYSKIEPKTINKAERDDLGRFVKGFKHSEEWKMYIREKMKGREITWREKISKALMGHPGQKGTENYFYGKRLIPWNKGKKMPKSAREKMRRAKIGTTLNEEHKRKIGRRIKELGIKPPIIRGARHHSWKGGITPTAEKIRKSIKYRQWRFAIFRRDNFTCQLCGKKGIYIECDHFPKRFSEIIEEFKIKSLKQALFCKKLWDTNNGRTLCQICHNSTRKK